MLLQYLTAGMLPRRLRIFMAEKSRAITCGDVGVAGGANPDHNAHACWWQHHLQNERIQDHSRQQKHHEKQRRWHMPCRDLSYICHTR